MRYHMTSLPVRASQRVKRRHVGYGTMTTMTAPDQEHARYSPSAASRWLRCAASVPLTEQLRKEGRIPASDPGNISTLRGSIIHELIALATQRDLDKTSSGLEEVAQKAIEKGRETHHEMKYVEDMNWNECVEVADRMMVMTRAWLDDRSGDKGWKTKQSLVETKFKVQAPVPMSGTGDLVEWQYKSGVGDGLLVLDYKSGLINVRAVRNPQLMIYAYLAAHHIWDHIPAPLHVTLVIVQPQGYSGGVTIDSWDTTISHVSFFVENDVPKAIELSRVEEPAFTPGVEQCRYCPARTHCPALRDLTNQLLKELEKMDSLSDRQIAAHYDKIKLLLKLKKDIRERVLSDHIKEGFVKVDRNQRVWERESEGFAKLMEEYKDTPGQIRDLEALLPLGKLSPGVQHRAAELGALVRKVVGTNVKTIGETVTDGEVDEIDDVW